MQITTAFDIIKTKASEDTAFRDKLLAAYESDKPIINFCQICNENGIEVYPMDIADADESAYAAMRRSTNGGGENAPHLDWPEDAFSSFVAELKSL